MTDPFRARPRRPAPPPPTDDWSDDAEEPTAYELWVQDLPRVLLPCKRCGVTAMKVEVPGVSEAWQHVDEEYDPVEVDHPPVLTIIEMRPSIQTGRFAPVALLEFG